MLKADKVLSSIPGGLRKPLLDEYNLILQNYMEQRWSPSELSGGRFCEVVFTIIDGMAKGSYASKPSKPSNIVDACRQLENQASLPRGLRILVPRLLPALYEIRNNRGVGHVGGDVDPNYMDSNAVLAMCSWVMAELIRVHHSLTSDQAQEVVDILSQQKIPVVWEGRGIKRVLNPKVPLKNQILLLVASCPSDPTTEELISWTDTKNKAHFNKVITQLHKERLIEHDKDGKTITILPPGTNCVSEIVAKEKPNK